MSSWRDLLSRYRDIVQQAWRERRPETQCSREELDFLPASLSLMEAPPAALSRPILLTVCALVVIAVLWACFGYIDIIVTANGRVLPSGNVKVLQPLQNAIVRDIHVRDGDHVRAGQLLVSLDPTDSSADLAKARVEWTNARLEQMRAKQLLAAEMTDTRSLPALRADADMPEAMVAEHNRLMQEEYMEYRNNWQLLIADITRMQAGRETTKAMLARLEESAPFQKARTEDMRELYAKAYVARHALQDQEQKLVDMENEIRVQRKKLDEVGTLIAKQERQKEVTRSEFRRKFQEKQADAQRRSQELVEEVRKLEGSHGLTALRASVSGTVQQLAVHTIGGVVTAAQPLLVVVPDNDQLEAEVLIENRDIGFVEQGMSAELKIDAFPFTRYGTIPAKLGRLSLDAVQDEKKGLMYMGRLILSRSQMAVDKKTIPLSSGMTVRAEIRTGERRIIEYFLSPLIQYKDESLRER